MTPQLTLNDLCGYLPFDLKVYDIVSKRKKIIKIGFSSDETYVGINSALNYTDVYIPIFRNLATDLTRNITHGNETFVPIREIHDLEIYGWGELEYYIDNNLEINVDALPYRLIKKLRSWHFWLGDQSYFEKGIILDYNDATNVLNPKTEK